MKERAEKFLAGIKAGRLQKGAHAFLTDPAISEAFGYFGYDFVWIDAEHGHFDKEKILAHITSANCAGAAAFVRAAAGTPEIVKPILEMGPEGIIIPLVESPEQARSVMSACLYPPEGKRGFGPRRAQGYGLTPVETYLDEAAASTLVFLQIEHVDAVYRISEICAVPGIGGIILGPFDLSGSVGLLGQVNHPTVMQLCRQVIAACKDAAVPCGISVGPGDREYIRHWVETGIDFIACGDDLSFLRQGSQEILGFFKELEEERK